MGSGVDGRAGPRWLDAVWLFPPTFVIHLTEEYLAAGGFPLWAERTLAIRFSNAEFTAWSTLALGLTCLGAWLVSRDSKFRFIEISLAIAVLGNVAMHVVATCSISDRPDYSTWIASGEYVFRHISRHDAAGSDHRS